MDLSALRTDKALTNEGSWVNDILPGVNVKILAATASAVKKFTQAQMKPYGQLGKEPSIEEQEDIGAKTLAYALVKDWTGVALDGVEIPFSSEAAYKLFKDIPAFANAIATAASNLSNFKIAGDAELIKNS